MSFDRLTLTDLHNIGKFSELLTKLTDECSNLEDVQFQGSKSIAQTYEDIKGKLGVDLVYFIKFVMVRGQNFSKITRRQGQGNNDRISQCLGSNKLNVWSPKNLKGNSAMFIQICCGPITMHLRRMIPEPKIKTEILKGKALPMALRWPGSIALVPIDEHFKKTFMAYYSWLQHFIRQRKKPQETVKTNQEIAQRQTKQIAFNANLVNSLTEETKKAWMANKEGTLVFPLPFFKLNSQLSDKFHQIIEDAIPAIEKWSDQDIINYHENANNDFPYSL